MAAVHSAIGWDASAMKLFGQRRPPDDPAGRKANLTEQVKVFEALADALDRRQEVFELLGAAPDPDTARSQLEELLGIDTVGAQAVLDMQLRRVPASERDRITTQLQELRGNLQRMADAMMTSDEFFRRVDQFLTPPMALLGYHRIGGSENDQPMSRAMLTPLGAPSHESKSSKKAPFLLYDFGFEAGSHDVERLLDPEDSGTAEELWLFYEPATGELDLRDWRPIAEGRVNWDPWTDTGPCSAPEVRRRLADIGKAVMDFVQAQDGSPPTS